MALAGDASGGAIAALVALPYGLALARLMGLPPELGLFTSILTAPITSLLGRNPVLIGGTASATVPFIAAAVRARGYRRRRQGLPRRRPVFLMIFCVLRLGRYVAKVPHAVVSGFSCGVGAMMVILQLRTLLGLPASPRRVLGQPAGQLISVLASSGARRGGSRSLLGSIVIAGGRLRLPALAALARAAARGRAGRRRGAPSRLARAAARERRLESAAVRAVHLGAEPMSRDVVPAALGLAFVTAVNILITSRVVEHFQGRHRPLRAADADAELGAYGIANLFAGVFGAPMSVGIPARSLANVRCGGTTRLSNFLHAVFLVAAWSGSARA